MWILSALGLHHPGISAVSAFPRSDVSLCHVGPEHCLRTFMGTAVWVESPVTWGRGRHPCSHSTAPDHMTRTRPNRSGGEGGLQWKITQFSPSIPYKLKRKWMQLLWYAGANLDIDAIFSRLPWIFLKLLPFCPSLMVLFSNLLAEGRKGRPPGEDSFPGRIGCEHTGNNPTNTWRHNSLTHKNWVLKTASF